MSPSGFDERMGDMRLGVCVLGGRERSPASIRCFIAMMEDGGWHMNIAMVISGQNGR